jgi:hypothetical protein
MFSGKSYKETHSSESEHIKLFPHVVLHVPDDLSQTFPCEQQLDLVGSALIH